MAASTERPAGDARRSLGSAVAPSAFLVFADIPRTDARPMQHGEGRFAFLNRSASVYFGHVRDLIEDWASHYPVAHRPGLLGALRADHAQFESGFWELFLHEGYRRSGFEIEIHPEIDGRTTRPDFLVQHGDESFYLEAVSVGRDPREVAEDRRLEAVYRVLSDMRVADFTIEVSHYGIGPQPLSTRQLRDALRGWLASLDPDEVAAFASASLAVGFGSLAGIAMGGCGLEPGVPCLPASRGDPGCAAAGPRDDGTGGSVGRGQRERHPSSPQREAREIRRAGRAVSRRCAVPH